MALSSDRPMVQCISFSKHFKPGDVVETPTGRIAKVVKKGWQRYLLKYEEGDEVTLMGKYLKLINISFTDRRPSTLKIHEMRVQQGKIVGKLHKKK